MESGWGHGWQLNSFFLRFHLFFLFPFNEIRCQSALGRLSSVRGRHTGRTGVFAFVLGREAARIQPAPSRAAPITHVVTGNTLCSEPDSSGLRGSVLQL